MARPVDILSVGKVHYISADWEDWKIPFDITWKRRARRFTCIFETFREKSNSRYFSDKISRL